MQLKKQKVDGQSRLARMSKIFALAKGTAKMAKNMMLLHEVEVELETEIEKDKSRTEPTTKIGKLRRRGEHLVHGKYVLLTVVILNVLDCLLVLGELMLDINYVTDLLTNEYTRSEEFIGSMKALYPARLGHLGTRDIDALEHEITLATLTWNNAFTEKYNENGSVDNLTQSEMRKTTAALPSTLPVTSSDGNGFRIRRSPKEQSNTTYPTASRYVADDDPTRSTEVKVVKGLHKTSITILTILVVETFFKMFCFGKRMLQYKLECFDGFIIISSFIVDVVFIKGLQQFTVQEYILILGFIVPWRIIRVVNSLVVAINCHEHFRLVIVYKQTKKISAELKDVKKDNKTLESCIEVLVNMCVEAGLPDTFVKTKLAQHKMERKHSKKKSKASGQLSNFKVEDNDILSQPDTENRGEGCKNIEEGSDIEDVDDIVVRL